MNYDGENLKDWEINGVARKISVTPPQGAENFAVNK